MDKYFNVQQIENRTQIFAKIADKKRHHLNRQCPPLSKQQNKLNLNRIRLLYFRHQSHNNIYVEPLGSKLEF